MEILRDLEPLRVRRFADPIVTWGVFDGVHRGHRAVLDHAVLWAGARRRDAVVLTFHPHPQTVLTGRPVPLLTTPDQRLRLLTEFRFRTCVVIPFTPDFARTSPERFVDDVVVGRLRARGVVLGPDSMFGRERSGNLDLLRRLAASRRLEVYTCPPLREDGRVISSTFIRGELAAGRLETAARALGRRFALAGTVVRGDGRGRSLGFPTANLDVSGLARPPAGVYGAIARLGLLRWSALVNIGTRPTVTGGSGAETVEAHLLSFDGRDLYGKVLEIEFLGRIRGERRFPSVNALKRQIARDRHAFLGNLWRRWTRPSERDDPGLRLRYGAE